MRAQATELGRVMLITDRRLCSDLVATIAAALAELPPRAALVQLREKDLEGRELLALATALLGVCRPRGAPLVINDRIDVVLASGADGVHLPERGFDLPTARALLGPNRLIGASIHAATPISGADYLVFGPVWATPSKASFGPPQGLEALTQACTAAPCPVFAVGGITTAAQTRAARAAGAHGIAAIRHLLTASAPGDATRRLHRAATS